MSKDRYVVDSRGVVHSLPEENWWNKLRELAQADRDK